MEKNGSFYCFFCDKKITTGENQYLHFENHVDWKTFKCHKCNQQFSEEIEKERHLTLSCQENYEKSTNINVQKFITFLSAISPQLENVNETDIRNYTMLSVKKKEEDKFTTSNIKDKQSRGF
uniref:C2H2-type domain-containing protein n=1 Tax=Strongyloides stercoralis TaxID=6248 RepID=A0A0K0EHR2_STRER